MEYFKAGLVLASVLSLAGCVATVTDYYEDYDYPAPHTVYAEERPLVVERPIVVRQRPVVVREQRVIVHQGPSYHPEVIVSRPSHHNRLRYEEAGIVRPPVRAGQTTVVKPLRHQEDDNTAVVQPKKQSRNDREESSSVVVQRWDKTRNVAPPMPVAERPYNNGTTTVIERQ